jgi:hypothetical protein
MATRYWVGGSGTWDATTTTNWSASSGGAGGASAPTSADDVVFNSSSGAAPTVTIGTNAACGAVTITAPTSGTLTFAFSTTGIISYNGNWSNPASLFATTGSGGTNSSGFAAGIVYVGSGSSTLTTNGYTFPSTGFEINTSAGTLTLGGALTTSTGPLTVTQGTFTTNNYNITTQVLSSTTTNARVINLGSSTVTLNGSTNAIGMATTTNLTFNVGTSSIVLSGGSTGTPFNGGGLTFYDVSFTSTSGAVTATIAGNNTYRNLSFTAPASSGIPRYSFSGNSTITGTLTCAGASAVRRIMLQSSAIGTTRTLTVATFSPADCDFRDITIAGTAAPVSGTRLGDCGGNSGITFPSAKTVYWNLAGNNNWSATAWATSAGGAVAVNNFPLAQDTAIFTSTVPATGATTTVEAAWNIGTIDMSARTSNTMTLATGSQTPAIYGNWTNGTGTTLTGTGVLTFAGRGSQTITSAAKTFTQPITINTPSNSVTLQDAFTSSGTMQLVAGTFNAATYNVSIDSFLGNTAFAKTIAIGSGTWTVTGSGVAWNSGSASTVTGTGTISLTSASAKTFAGAGLSYSGITINQGGAGALTITGSNTFGNITNTYSATGATSILFTAGTTSTFTNWNASGSSGKLLTIGSVTAASHTLSKSSGVVSADYLSISRSTATGGASWYAGANSTNGGNNSGWIFSAAPTNSGNFFMLF